jgi:hypothetical protein
MAQQETEYQSYQKQRQSERQPRLGQPSLHHDDGDLPASGAAG